MLADCGCTNSCDTVYIVFGVSVCYVQQCCVYGRIGCGECWQTAVVLIPVSLYILVMRVSVSYVQQ